MAPLAIGLGAAALAVVSALICFAVLLFLKRRDSLYLGLPRLPRRAFLPAINQEQKLILESARISYLEIEDGDRSGILVRGLQLRRVLDALDLCAVSAVPARRLGRGVRELVSYQRLSPENQVIAGAYGVQELTGANQEAKFTRLVTDLVVPMAQRNCVIVHCRGSTVSPIDDGSLQILINSSALPYGAQSLPPSLFGLEHGLYGVSVYRPSQQGIPITDDSSGSTIAEVIGNNLYVLFDLFALPYEAQLGIAARLLQKAAPDLNCTQMLKRVLASLGAGGVDSDVPARGEKFAVSVSAEFASRQKEMLKFMTESLFSPALKRPIVITRTAQAVPANGFLIQVDPSITPAPASGRSVPVFDCSGTILAEISSQGLKILSNVARWGSRLEAEALGQILLEAKKLLPFLAVQEARMGELVRGRKAVADAAVDKLTADLLQQSCIAQVSNLPAASPEASKSIGQKLKTFQGQEQELLRLEAHPDESLGEEFDQLFQLASVRDVKVEDDKLIVSTDKLYCIDPRSGRRHEIGAFDIHLPTDSSNGAPTYFNRTRQVSTPAGTMQAPHVRSDGWACLGNVGDLFPQLIAKREFSSAVQVAIAYIESVNVDDSWGKYIDYWPMVG